MNKSVFLSVILSVVISCAVVIGVFYYKVNTKIAIVDTGKLLNNYKGMIAARKIYQGKTAAWKANIDTLASEVRSELLKYERERAKMSPRERQLSQELIKTKQNSLLEYQKALNSQAQQEDTKMTNEVVAEINAYLKKYGQAHRYKIIIAATQYGNVAYAEEAMDITDDVLDGLNKEHH